MYINFSLRKTEDGYVMKVVAGPKGVPDRMTFGSPETAFMFAHKMLTDVYYGEK